MLKIFLLIGFLGHLICGITDCMMAYSKKWKFDFSMAKEPQKMKEVFSCVIANEDSCKVKYSKCFYVFSFDVCDF